MNILKIIGIAIVAVTLILTVKAYRPEAAAEPPSVKRPIVVR